MNNFFAWFDATESAALQSPIGAALTPLGFTVHHTGGGCLAWRKELGAYYVLICDEGNGLGDRLDEKYLFGLYDSDGEEIGEGGTAPDLGAAIKAAESLLKLNPP